jgi:hypothetical protein
LDLGVDEVRPVEKSHAVLLCAGPARKHRPTVLRHCALPRNSAWQGDRSCCLRGSAIKTAVRHTLLRLRIYPLDHDYNLDPYSPEYLYLAQQRKRLSLSASVSRLRPRYLLISPFILVIIAVKLVDLWIANQIIRSLINEHDLMREILRQEKRGS